MAPFFIKLLVCPTAVLLVDILSTEVDYRTVYQAALVGLFLAILGRLMEGLTLKRRSVWISTFLDFAAAFVVVYLSTWLFPGSRVTVMGALMVAIILGITEYLQHIVLVQANKREKQK